MVPVERCLVLGRSQQQHSYTYIYRAGIRSSVDTAVATAAAVVSEKVGGRSIGKKGYSTW